MWSAKMQAWLVRELIVLTTLGLFYFVFSLFSIIIYPLGILCLGRDTTDHFGFSFYSLVCVSYARCVYV